MNLFTYLLACVRRNDEGQDLLEYALLVALIAIVCVVAIQILGGEANSSFSSIGSGVN